MTRDEVIDAGEHAVVVEAEHLGRAPTYSEVVAVVIDAVEGLIRADEREFLAPEVPMARDDLRNELRAQVNALPSNLNMYGHPCVRRVDVLALLDGGNDG